jgi:hypothetical protein
MWNFDPKRASKTLPRDRVRLIIRVIKGSGSEGVDWIESIDEREARLHCAMYEWNMLDFTLYE